MPVFNNDVICLVARIRRIWKILPKYQLSNMTNAFFPFIHGNQLNYYACIWYWCPTKLIICLETRAWRIWEFCHGTSYQIGPRVSLLSFMEIDWKLFLFAACTYSELSATSLVAKIVMPPCLLRSLVFIVSSGIKLFVSILFHFHLFIYLNYLLYKIW